MHANVFVGFDFGIAIIRKRLCGNALLGSKHSRSLAQLELRQGPRRRQFGAEKAVKFESRLETPAYRILHRDTLAAAYAEAGRFDDAIEEQNKTISMVKANGWDTVTYDHEPLLEILKRHLKQFENREPLRGGPY